MFRPIDFADFKTIMVAQKVDLKSSCFQTLFYVSSDIHTMVVHFQTETITA